MAVRHAGHAAEVFDAALGDYVAFINDRNTRAHLLYDLEGVRGHKDGHRRVTT